MAKVPKNAPESPRAGLVLAVWEGETVFNPEQGILENGDYIWVTREQADDPNTLAKEVN